MTENFSNREQKLIKSIKEWTEERLIGDDCALLPGQDIVTSDLLVEDVHFSLALTSPQDLGWKALAVNLSDIAAMAGRPRYALVSISLPATFDDRQFQELYQGLIECAKAHKTRIVGGDLTGGDKLVISVTLIGDVHESGCFFRSGATAGDLVIVSGDFGASAAGLNALRQGSGLYRRIIEKHLRPYPRLCESWLLARTCQGRGALMDASDGLADALLQISRLSGVGIAIQQDAIPIHPETISMAKSAGQTALELALYGGEDYELVACLSEIDWGKIQESGHNPFTLIGKVEKESGVRLCSDHSVTPLDMSKTFRHW
ncbi:MAG: thiamine-phosphate kinase [Candidatus Obscuribacterales bacterium]|nr:thiamine-phosphate kinase [Candidatus Obscuribacterales bacterium]